MPVINLATASCLWRYIQARKHRNNICGDSLPCLHFLQVRSTVTWHLAPGTHLVCEILGEDDADSDKSESVWQGGCTLSAPCMGPQFNVLVKKTVTTSRCFS